MVDAFHLDLDLFCCLLLDTGEYLVLSCDLAASHKVGNQLNILTASKPREGMSSTGNKLWACCYIYCYITSDLQCYIKAGMATLRKAQRRERRRNYPIILPCPNPTDKHNRYSSSLSSLPDIPAARSPPKPSTCSLLLVLR